MPAKFNRCVKKGGKVRTINLSKTKYKRVCIPKGGSGSIGGHTKRKKEK